MEEEILKAFPELIKDVNFKISSKQSIKYNCIAWAALFEDRWLWPPGGYSLDGVVFFWPSGIEASEKIETFIRLFESYGYEICISSDYEEGYRKIALFQDDIGDCTHAARQKGDGLWTSKLGCEHDIEHKMPHSIEGLNYGKIAQFMRKKK